MHIARSLDNFAVWAVAWQRDLEDNVIAVRIKQCKCVYRLDDNLRDDVDSFSGHELFPPCHADLYENEAWP